VVDSVLAALGSVVAVATFVFATYQYWRAQQWKRVEFIFAQCHYLETDPCMRTGARILEGKELRAFGGDLSAQLEALFQRHDDPEMYDRRTALDRVLGLLDRLAYAVDESHALSLAELAEFGWHVRTVYNTPRLREYCLGSYPCILAIAPDLGEYISARWPEVVCTTTPPEAQPHTPPSPTPA
jgi:hypothetical protein